jgi:hypothetical protein
MRRQTRNWMRVLQDTVLLPVTAKTVPADVVEALEAKRIRRLRELGDWRPSNGWHIEPVLPAQSAMALHESHWTKQAAS